jgi:hypothetical protein
MIDYATIANTSGAFPSVVGLNSTGAGNLDGTPYIKSVIDDLWGFSQALMNAASLTPDAVTESSTASQRLEAVRRISGYPGEGVFWLGDEADPSSLGIRLLPLNGQTVNINTYPELDDSCYVGNTLNPTASAFYRTSDAGGTTRNTAGPYLVLPDMRGVFARGLDTSGTVDPGGASRDIGNNQAWAILDHSHVNTDSGGVGSLEYQAFDKTGLGAGSDNFTFWQAAGGLTGPVRATTMYNTTLGTITSTNKNQNETRPVNVTGRWCIRY